MVCWLVVVGLVYVVGWLVVEVWLGWWCVVVGSLVLVSVSCWLCLCCVVWYFLGWV